MPEGPMMHLFRDALSTLRGLHLAHVMYRRATPDLSILEGKRLESLSTWGKYLFLHFGPGHLHLRIHWGMFGVYYIDEPRKGKDPVLHLQFSEGRDLYLYTVSLRLLEGALSQEEYDPRIDIMSPDFDVAAAVKSIREAAPDRMICDVLMDQSLFAGLGNVIKNEALFALQIDPQSLAGELPAAKLRPLVEEVVDQAQLFLVERRAAGGYGHTWVRIYRKKRCPECGGPATKEPTGEGRRMSHWCGHCQRRY